MNTQKSITMNHQETYNKSKEAISELFGIVHLLTDNDVYYNKAKNLLAILNDIQDSEHEHIINEIQNQPIAEWKP